MEQAQIREELAHRRSAARLRLATDAHFMGLERRQPVTLLDLSQTGARFAFWSPCVEKAGFLEWLGFETFGELIWQEGLYVGIAFDEPIDHQWLLDTRERCQSVDQAHRDKVMEAAREWVSGESNSR